LIPSLERYLHGYGAPVAVDEARLEESWDFANYDVPDLIIDDYRVGKAFTLDCVSAWYGVKSLEDEQHGRVAEASRRETFARLPDKIDGASPDLAVRLARLGAQLRPMPRSACMSAGVTLPIAS